MATDAEPPGVPIINNILCFLVNKINVMDSESLIHMCENFYSDEAIESSKELIFSYLQDEKSTVVFTKRKVTKYKTSDSKKVKNLNDIILLLQEKGTSEKFPVFVVKDLFNLPPISVNNIDATALAVQIENVAVNVNTMKSAMTSQTNISESLYESVAKIVDRLTHLESHTGINNIGDKISDKTSDICNEKDNNCDINDKNDKITEEMSELTPKSCDNAKKPCEYMACDSSPTDNVDRDKLISVKVTTKLTGSQNALWMVM